jgi:hypothetical protein
MCQGRAARAQGNPLARGSHASPGHGIQSNVRVTAFFQT